MQNLKWKDEYSVGVELFDSDHKELFKLFERIQHQIEDDDDIEELCGSCFFLRDYVIYHLAIEELIMEENGYPDFENHKVLHDNFRTEVLALNSAFEKQDKEIIKTIPNFISNWLSTHIMTVDKKYASFLKGATIPECFQQYSRQLSLD